MTNHVQAAAARVQAAVARIGGAIAELKAAKRDLLVAGSYHHTSLAVNLAGLEETYQAMTDPALTPEILEGVDEEGPYDPDYDPCIWDGNRIDATKSVLFHEYLGRGRK